MYNQYDEPGPAANRAWSDLEEILRICFATSYTHNRSISFDHIVTEDITPTVTKCCQKNSGVWVFNFFEEWLAKLSITQGVPEKAEIPPQSKTIKDARTSLIVYLARSGLFNLTDMLATNQHK